MIKPAAHWMRSDMRLLGADQRGPDEDSPVAWEERFIQSRRKSLERMGVVIPEDTEDNIWVLGRGAYASVLPMQDPRLVCKITYDQTDGIYAQFLADLQARNPMEWDGFALVDQAHRGPLLSEYSGWGGEDVVKGMSVYVIIREAINPRPASAELAQLVVEFSSIAKRMRKLSAAERAFDRLINQLADYTEEEGISFRGYERALDEIGHMRRSIHAAIWEFGFLTHDLHIGNLSKTMYRKGNDFHVVADFGVGNFNYPGVRQVADLRGLQEKRRHFNNPGSKRTNVNLWRQVRKYERPRSI